MGQKRTIAVTAIRERGVRAGAALLVSALILLFDPFNFSRWTAYAAGELARIALSAQSPPPPEPRISVVLADDRLLTDEALARPTWPLAWSVWGDLITAAADMGASSIFVDVMFVDSRPQADVAHLSSAIEYAAGSAIVYLAASSPSETATFREIHPALADLANRNPNIRLVSILRGDRLGLTYGYRLQSDEAGRPAAALAIQRDLCARGLLPADRCVARLPAGDLDLWWSRPDAAACEPYAGEDFARQVLAGCRNLAPSWPLRLAQTALAGLLSGVRDADGLAAWGLPPVALVALPFPTLEARHVLAGRVTLEAAQRLDGGVVMIGASFPGALDLFESSVYGDVPGVYSHAAALQTLASPERVLATELGGRWAELGYTLAFVGVSVSLATLGFSALVLFGAPFAAADWAARAIMVLAIGASAAFELYYLRVGPSAWGIVLGVTATSHPLSVWLAQRYEARRRTRADASKSLRAKHGPAAGGALAPNDGPAPSTTLEGASHD